MFLCCPSPVMAMSVIKKHHLQASVPEPWHHRGWSRDVILCILSQVRHSVLHVAAAPWCLLTPLLKGFTLPFLQVCSWSPSCWRDWERLSWGLLGVLE